MKHLYFTLLFAFTISFFGCQQKENEIITNRFQYDVNIKSPDPEYDWWIQNIVGPQREKLVELIVDGAKSGKYQAWDYFNNPIDRLEVANIFADTIVVTMMEENPPYNEYDTIFVYNILNEDILRLRFLEEWSINPENLQIEKKIMGIAPIARRLDFNGIERWQPLFWIYSDEEFLKELKKTNL